ncbi:MAG: hypothetical protein ISR80_05110 [Nitrosopumilus sp.]|nr:hypothetical protein [Nitrosopumilus sp.]
MDQSKDIPDEIYKKMFNEFELKRFKLKQDVKELESRVKKGEVDKNQFTDKSEKSILLPKLTLAIEDSSKITKMIYEDIERGVYSSKIITKPASNCIELNIELIWYGLGTIATAGGIAYAKTFGEITAKRSANYLCERIGRILESRSSPKNKSKIKKKQKEKN